MAEEVLTFCKWKPGTKEARGLLSLLLLILGCAQFLLPGVEGSGEAWLKSEKHAEFGTEIQLPCILKLPQCIGLHSIKWYQGNKRIFVYSAEGEMTLANDEVASRMKMVVPKNNMTKSYLKISNLTLEDEALYKCEVTYLAVNRECNTVQHITLNVTVQPTSVRVIDESTKQTLEDGRVLGPVIEGSPIALRCEGGKGRPVPTVEWYNGDVKLKSESSQELEEHEIGTGSGTLNLVVARSELGATFTCKVSSLALAEPLKIDIKLDVHVRPMKMDIKGVVGHVIQGSKVLLQCEVQGARPPANVTWYNGTDILEKNNSRLDMYETKLTDNDDGTTQTNSFLAFTASEHDNGRKFSCAAVNSVMLKEGSKPMTETVIMEVMYPPLVRMSPDNITVNETEDFQLFCDYEANPATLLSVIWQRDGKNLTLNDERYEGGTIELTSLLVKNATANDIGKYSCILENDFGISNSQEFIDVSVLFRPTVSITVEPDPPINEADRLNVSLSCNVKTGNPSYLTAVRWYLDGSLLKELPDCSLNTSTEELCDIDPSKLLLESVGRSFHGNYSCEGKNDAGWGPISSNTPVIVHFPPENLTVSPKRVNVTVDNIPPPIRCNATSRPDPSYRWEREGSTDHNNGFDGPVLKFKEPITRDKSGIYICQAFNRIGQATISTFIDVQYKPECRVDKEVMDGKDYVVCIADGNPAEYTFKWSLKSDNDTIEEKPVTINGRSYLLLDDSVSNPRTYVCVAKNVIDDSSPCERHVPASIPWWLRLDGDLLVIVIATTVIIILIIIVVCVIIFLMCRRKHSKLKYPSQAANSNHHMDSVSEGLSEPETKTFYENLPFHGIQSPPNKLVIPKFTTTGSHTTTAVALHGCAYATTLLEHSSSATLLSISPCSSRPPSRAASLCGGFIGNNNNNNNHNNNNGYGGGNSSGYESSTGGNGTRGSHLGPHYSDHNMPRGNSPEPKYNSLKPRRRKQQQHHQRHAQFYSLRLCRKHQHHHRHHHRPQLSQNEEFPQFDDIEFDRRSLGSLSSTTRNYQLYAIPIYRTCPHKSPSSSTLATSVRSLDFTPTSTLTHEQSEQIKLALTAGNEINDQDDKDNFEDNEDEDSMQIPPIPAPRITKKTDPAEHTYINVPSPVFPQNLPSDSKLKRFTHF